MAMSAETVFEVRDGGNDSNGGGYVSDAGTTDFSQQAAAELTVTDGATSGIGVTTLTSATGGFTAQMVGSIVHLYDGTNLTDHWFEIKTYVDTNEVTLDRAPDDGVGGVSAADVKVGGALATPGCLGKILLAQAVSGMKAWIKAATYTLTTSTDGPGGPFDLGAKAATLIIEGYQTTRGDLGTAPVLNAGAQTSVILWSTSVAGKRHRFVNLKADGNSGASNSGFYLKYAGQAYKCEAVNCPLYGFYGVSGTAGGQVEYCKATNGVYGFYKLLCCRYCASIGSTNDGFHTNMFQFNCIVHGAADNGFQIDNSNGVAMNCTADGCGGEGFYLNTAFCASLVNCLATNNGGYGFNFVDAAKGYAAAMANCAGYNNTSGHINTQSWLGLDTGFVTLTVDPYVARGSDDFRPNNVAGGGAELRAGGIGAADLLVSDNQDIGAVQHADPPGGVNTGPIHQQWVR